MNRIFLVVLFLIPLLGIAQAPQKVSYQFVLRDNSGSLIIEEEVGVRISILQGEDGENPVYSETHSVLTNSNGAGSLEIGAGMVEEGSFSAINWSQGPFQVQADTDPDGGSNYQISGTSPILSVPYALYALNGYEYHVGDMAQGGIIFSVWKDSLGLEHGLVLALEDAANSEEWGPLFSDAGANSASNGQLNMSTSIPAEICESYSYQDPETGQVFDDWYLPAVWELRALGKEAFIINSVLNSDGDPNTYGLPEDLSSIYWSSTEVGESFAWSVNIHTSVPSASFKDDNYKVRAIRRF
jgi:hypothetical protein